MTTGASLKWLAIMACAATLAACAAQTQPRANTCLDIATSGADVDAVRAAEHHVARVTTDAWTLAEVAQVFAPEFQSVQPNGAVHGIDQVLGEFVNGRTSPWAARYEIVELDIRVFGCATASATGVAEVQPRSGPAMRWRFTDAWRKQNGAWLYARNQYVAIPP
jgi:hypothetical protein